jgi:hypothetical protein
MFTRTALFRTRVVASVVLLGRTSPIPRQSEGNSCMS